jgi:integrase
MALTLRTVQELKPGQVIWDDAVAGFGVRRQRDSAAYVLKYRFAGQQRFVTIGRHGSPWTPEQARREARRLLGLVAADRDPRAERHQAKAKAVETLGRVAEEYLARARTRLKRRSLVEVERHLRHNWRPLHGISVFKLTRRQVAARLTAIEADRGPVAAARARAALSAMFNWAIREGFEIPANPVAGTNRPAEPRSRSRVLSDDELGRLWRVCRDDDYGRIIRLLILTGQRREEVGGMQWSEIRLPSGTWIIPAARTKNHREHTVSLTEVAVALLPPPRSGPWLFGRRGFSAWSKSKAALDTRSGVQDWRVHDIRRTVATGMADRLGVLPHVIETVLNHVSGHQAGVAGVYNRARYADSVKDALARWAEHVAQLSA